MSFFLDRMILCRPTCRATLLLRYRDSVRGSFKFYAAMGMGNGSMVSVSTTTMFTMIWDFLTMDRSMPGLLWVVAWSFLFLAECEQADLLPKPVSLLSDVRHFSAQLA